MLSIPLALCGLRLVRASYTSCTVNDIESNELSRIRKQIHWIGHWKVTVSKDRTNSSALSTSVSAEVESL